MQKPLIVVLGPTAIGKTRLSCYLCKTLNGELISADSRQIYTGMDIGTGKDLEDFKLPGFEVPYHLIDIKKAGETYSVFDFQHDFLTAFQLISDKDKYPVLCGGTGMYLSAALQEHKLIPVPTSEKLRAELALLTNEELTNRLSVLKSLHNTSDTLDRDRLLRAIEIAEFEQNNPKELMPKIPRIVFGIRADRELIKANIHARLKDRIANGMIEEVEQLVADGVTHEQLNYYGLEYRYVSLFLQEKIDKNHLFTELYKSICNFAKRQMTWYRRMEKQGISIHWIEGILPLDEQINSVLGILAKS